MIRTAKDNDVENNVVVLSNFKDPSTGEMVDHQGFILPSEAWKDFNSLDWALAPQQENWEDST